MECIAIVLAIVFLCALSAGIGGYFALAFRQETRHESTPEIPEALYRQWVSFLNYDGKGGE